MRLINADALKQEIRKGTRYFVRVWDPKGREKWEMEKDLSLKEIDEIIDNAPTIDAEPVKYGKWEEYLPEGLRWKCSLCESRFVNPYIYCPHCGARMEW